MGQNLGGGMKRLGIESHKQHVITICTRSPNYYMKLLCATIKLDREVAPCGTAHFDYLPYGRYVNTLQNFNLVPNGTYIRQKSSLNFPIFLQFTM